jgi:Mucin-2 protein WxxW repeating region
MKPTVFAMSAGLMMMSVQAFAAPPPPPPDIKPGAPVNSCCRVDGEEGLSQQAMLGGELIWTCHLGAGFATAWDAGRLPYNVLESRLRGRIGNWSPWFNRDLPSGAGDYELDQDLIQSKQVCANPIMIECRTVEGEVDWRNSRSVYHCDLSRGGYCVNKEQALGQSCEDFEVRYLCPNILLSTGGFLP